MKRCSFCRKVIEGDIEFAIVVDNIIYPYCCSVPCGKEHEERLEGLKLLAEAEL